MKENLINAKIGLSINSAIIRFILTYIVVEIIVGGIFFGICLGILLLFSINDYTVYTIFMLIETILSIFITTKIISKNYVVSGDKNLFINKLNIVWISFLIFTISINLYGGYKRTYSHIITLEAAEVGYESKEKELSSQQDGDSTNKESLEEIYERLEEIHERKKEVIVEDIVLPIALINIIFIIQVLMTNKYSKNKLFDNQYIKENK